MQYKIFNPTITTSTVVDSYNNGAGLTYFSNSSMAYYGGKYWPSWMATSTAIEKVIIP
jgi:hypothetical protein